MSFTSLHRPLRWSSNVAVVMMVGSLARAALVVALSATALSCSSSDEPPAGTADGGIDDAGSLDAPAEGSTWQSGPISVVEEPGSTWTVAEEQGEVVARHVETDLALLIDPSNADEDQRYAGIYLFEDGLPRYLGRYYGSDCSMFVPDRPHVDQTTVTVTAAGSVLEVEMTEGSLAEMVDAQFPSDEPFRWTTSWSRDAEGLRLQASGLYYLLVPMESCDVTVFGEGGVLLGSTHIDTDTSPFLDYFEDVRTIELLSQPLGALSVGTDAEVLQVEVPSYPDTSLFELDFDHSFKDRGQLDVHAELVLPVGL